LKTEVLSAREGDTVARAAELLRNGEVVALPTETVYGLAADANRDDAVLKIFQTKSRPRFDPLIVHLPGADWVDRLVRVEDTVRERFEQLRNRFWPGPLTFVFPHNSNVSDLVTAGLDSVAVRLSTDRIFSQVISAFGAPLAAPSANRFGRISPTSAAHVVAELDGLIPMVVDAGPTAHGLESTIIALRNDRIEVLRRGPVTEEQLADFGEVVVATATALPEAPGQLPTHYAPKTRLVLVSDRTKFDPAADKRCGMLAWNPDEAAGFVETLWISRDQDPVEAAKNLYRCLRELDEANLDLIVAETVPDEGLGAAINDRLRRAASSA
jgi:L-threonylcarbamoyladenylate synthase